MILKDAVTLQTSTRSYTKDGFLDASAVICRTGIQEYLGAELPVAGLEPKKRYKIYRAPAEVFNDDAMQSFCKRPITNDHPYDVGGYLTPDTAKQKVVGGSGSGVRRENDTIIVDVSIWDRETIQDIESGKVGLSCGYATDVVMTPGMTPDGKAYDGVQKNPRGNHIAVCDVAAARGGFPCKILDQKGSNMREELPDLSDLNQLGQMLQAVASKVDALAERMDAKDAPVDEPVEVAEEILQDEDMVETVATDSKALLSEVEKLRGQVAAFRATDTTALVQKQVNDRIKLLDSARQVIPTLDSSLSDLEIKKQVVSKINSGIALDSKDAAYIDGCYDAALQTYVGGANAAKELGSAIKQSIHATDAQQDAFAEVDSGDMLRKAAEARNERMRNLHKRGA